MISAAKIVLFFFDGSDGNVLAARARSDKVFKIFYWLPSATASACTTDGGEEICCLMTSAFVVLNNNLRSMYTWCTETRLSGKE